MYKKFYLYKRSKCKLLKVVEHTHPDLGSKLLAKIFYLDDLGKGWFRWVDIEDITITNEDCDIKGDNDLELVNNYGHYMMWVEDDLYKFVSYNFIKI